MYKIGIIGPETCQKTKEVKDLLFQIKQTFGDTATIVSGGNNIGIEKDVKKYCIYFELPYQEYNPSFAGKNQFSALDESYFNKKFHPSHFQHRYEMMLRHVDKLFIGYEKGQNFKLYEQIQKKSEKKGIKVVLI